MIYARLSFGQVSAGISMNTIRKRFGEKIREFPQGIERLFNNCQILPVWTEGGGLVIPNTKVFPKGPYFLFPKIWRKTKIYIGEPLEIKPENFPEKCQLKKFLEDELLKLADASHRLPN